MRAGRWGPGMTGLDPAEFLSLVEAAALAPSADNRREVQLEHAGRRVRLWGDQTWRSAPEHRRIMSLVAIGAAVENVKLRAGRLGFETKVCWFPDSGNPGLVAEIDVDRLPQTRVDPIEVAIERRRTNRRVRFRGPPLSQGELGALSAEATGIDGIQLHWFDSPETRKQILRLVRLAETERFRSRELHEELFSAVRFDIGWTASSDDGLPPGSLEVEAWMRPMFRGLRHWRVLRLLRTVGMHHALGLRAAYLPCRLAPHVGALTTSLDLASGALTAGAVFERIWLRTTLLGAELQPFAASAVLSLPACEWVAPHVRAALVGGWNLLAPGHWPMMVFRIGHARAPSVRTMRQSVEAYCYAPAERSGSDSESRFRKSSKLFVAGVAHARPPITASRTQMSWIPSLRTCRVNGMK